MFKLKPLLRDGDPDNTGGGQQTQTTQQSAAPATVDVQAQINAALAKQQAEFAEQLKAATGHADLKALTDDNLKKQGKLQELADAKAAEAQNYKAKFEQMAIGNALLSASTDAVDPDTIKDLLAGQAQVDEAGNVTINGKSAADAVAELLKAKPFLAKAQGGTGSGAPQNAGTAVKNPWTKEHYNLTEQISLQNTNPALAAQLKAAAGK